MSPVLLADLGSTFTKLVAVDPPAAEIVGRAVAPTTAREDITRGLREALAQLESATGIRIGDCEPRLACSSAAGGLRMVAVGLVPDLTAEAAKRAALGAGARVLGVYAYGLTRQEVKEIEDRAPDLILLAGGTDGGNEESLLRNARLLGQSRLAAPVIVAGNKTVATEAAEILHRGGKDARVTENVMPELGSLNVEPARQAIRDVFMEKIVEARGLHRVRELAEVVMPTPAAVLKAAEVLAHGMPGEEGAGELMVVDVGGATTDVHSVASGDPTHPGVILKGLAEPVAKRTVEGDLGVRVSAVSLWEAAGGQPILEHMGMPRFDVEAAVRDLAARTWHLPVTREEQLLDRALARVAVEIATTRHAGRLESFPTPFGPACLQYGKDLTPVVAVVGTGGAFVHSPEPSFLFAGAVFDPRNPTVLKPRAPRFLLDRGYILAAMGLLATADPAAALRMMKKYLTDIGNEEP